MTIGASQAPRAAQQSAQADAAAAWAFALSVLGIPLTAVVSAIAVVLAHRSLRRGDAASKRGAGLASAALVIGYGWIAVSFVALAFIVAYLVTSTSA